MKTRLVILLGAALLALPASDCLGDYIMPVAATTEGGGRGSDSRYALSFTVGQGCPVGTGIFANYILSSGLVALLSDVVPPRIIHEPPTIVAARAAIDIEALIQDDRTGVDEVALYYHEGGLPTFRQKTMDPAEDGSFVAPLSPASLTERGLVYYFEARDGMGNVARYPKGAPDSLLVLNIYSVDVKSGFDLPARQHRMVSVPGVPTSGHPDSVLADDLGPHHSATWRLGRWDARPGCGEWCYAEYPSLGGFAPGRAFWLIVDQARWFDFSGVPVDISRPFAVHLDRGWNQIATPFAFTTDWLSSRVRFGGLTYSVGESHITGSDTILVEDNLVSYDGSYHPFQSALAPWAGYWLYNASTAEVDLLLSPQVSGAQVASSRPVHGTQVAIEIRAGADGWTDACFLGTSPAALDGYDPLDLHKPPPIGEYVRIVLDRPSWGRNLGKFMSDVRQADGEGSAWDFRVETSSPKWLAVDVGPASCTPEGWQTFIYDIESGVKLPVASLPYRFRLDNTRDFVLICGTQGFIGSTEEEYGIDLRASIISATPNPFGQSVRITLCAPGAATVDLRVVSVEGRVVNTLLHSSLDSGVHTLIWDGRSGTGAPLAPGIYFLRLESEGRSIAHKLLKLR